MSRTMKCIYIFLFIIMPVQISVRAQSSPVGKYEAAEGKIVGIWPHNDRFKSIGSMKELNERWGFNYVLLAEIYGAKEKKLLDNAGFDSLHIMHQIILPNSDNERNLLLEKILRLGKLWAYYFDEPISRGQSFIQFSKLIIDLSNNGFFPYAKFIASELDEKKAARLLRIVDGIMYSGYGSSEKMGTDQAKTWAEWKKYLGEKFSLVWISAEQDSNEYRTLLKSAKELGFNSVWLYALEPIAEGKEVSNSNYEKFCEAAVEFGFMKLKKQNPGK
ncbi:MAG: hypothetical protein AB1775_07500 [Bacteroidota bacterium]